LYLATHDSAGRSVMQCHLTSRNVMCLRSDVFLICEVEIHKKQVLLPKALPCHSLCVTITVG